MTEQEILDLGWLAGFFEGEGSIATTFQIYKGTTSRYLRFHIGQKNIEPLLKVRRILTENGIDPQSIKIYTNEKKGWSQLNISRFVEIEKAIDLLFNNLSKKRQDQIEQAFTKYCQMEAKYPTFKEVWSKYCII